MRGGAAGKFASTAVLITGGTSGIGLAAAAHFAAEGATVFLTGRRQAQLDQAVAAVGARAIGIQGDVTSAADLERLFATIARTVDRLDVVVANAGAGQYAALGAYTEALVDATFALNVKGTVFTVQGALPLMPDGAAVVIVGSIEGFKGMAGLGLYAATKAALRSFARTWAVDLKARGIRFNVVSPGIVPTPAYDAVGVTRESFDPMLPTIPLGRLGTTDEVARAIAFLASDDSSYVNAAELVVDGGMTQV